MLMRDVLDLEKWAVRAEVPLRGVDLTEASWEWPSEFYDEVLSHLKSVPWQRYPVQKSPALLEAVASYLKVPSSHLLLTRGSSEGLRLALLETKLRGESLLLPSPGFFLTEELAQALHIPLFFYESSCMAESLSLQMPAKATRLLCLPNNPTGHTLSVEALRNILASCADALTVLDLTYDPFCDVPLSASIKDFYRENLIICLSFSKAFALAGARLGVLVADPCLINKLSSYQEVFVYDYFQWAVGHTLFQDKWLAFTEEKILQTKQLRATLYKTLHKADFCESLFPANANFITIRLRDPSRAQVFIEGTACKWFPDERLLRFTVNAKTHEFLAAHLDQEMA